MPHKGGGANIAIHNTENYLIPHCGILVYVSKDSLIQETHKLYCVYIIVLQTL